MKKGTEYLFHYTKFDTALKILEGQSLLAGKFYKSNDPMEDIGLSFYSNSFDAINSEEFSESLNSKLKKNLHFLSFSEGEYFLPIDYEYDGGKFLLEGSRPGYFYPRMWGQYGDSHTGACLVFDKERMLESVRSSLTDYEVMNSEVRYTDITDLSYFETVYESFRIDQENLKKHKIAGYISNLLKTKHRDLYFQKDLDWALEREYRILLYSNKDNISEEGVFIPIQDTLVAMFLGSKSNKNNGKMNQIIEESKFNIFEVNVGEGMILISKL
ncbi:DUF2971 domain-containing protein [Leptospira kmetyi]|uniref:DUF2971 domain-containing protein n=1 Tax=Leptospira kmetyi TaxID=408139 RepID=A0ABX4N566_9LEPT|nr:DUF2971 domain-containing protein [Leptospira kmetyi]PJZ28330.1 hypothetical protein CH378_18605 [Leptospira kmetyi]